MDAGPQHSNFEPQADLPTRDLARWLIFTHVLAAAICLAMSLADRSLLITPAFSRFFYKWCGVIVVPAVLSIFVFPLLMLFLAAIGRIRGKSAFWGILAEALLCVTHAYVSAPMVW